MPLRLALLDIASGRSCDQTLNGDLDRHRLPTTTIFRPPAMSCSSQAYVLENTVTHARLLPTASKHAFTYPTFCFLVSVNALERHSLDLGRGWVFGYGGRWLRLFGLRTDPYLVPGKRSIREKLVGVLTERGVLGLEDAWMMTMPSLLGFEGINPLTVYFCYNAAGELFVSVLEVHNTFGENHVYLLKLREGEDDEPPRGYDHQWTFPRAFHVSPFNDRRGFYMVSIRRPTHSPSASADSPPKPSVRIHLLTESKSLKLTALIRPTTSHPLTTPNVLKTLSKYPFDLFLSFARILYHAYILHYKKRLDVFVRPEPVPGAWLREEHNAGPSLPIIAGGTRVHETGISVRIVPGDANISPHTFSASKGSKSLTISLLSARAYTLIFVAPSPQHALLLGRGERVFEVSDEDLFVTLLSAPSSLTSPMPMPMSDNQRRRRRAAVIPLPGPSPDIDIAIPARHPLDGSWVATTVLYLLLLLDRVERLAFGLARARPVHGTEPWGMWERAMRVRELKGQDMGAEMEMVPRYEEGSLRS
ncbi:hypothetical protein HMN09_00191000 [Mycena chlorophos]|uniref:DUF1365-domain-containing protein n=1 Tax=Mycena chlorophos TaxID=658473 RepID=A0A8H6TNI2_MYCCL|nr:hypothetical protein HMN09_00191000 [Mycena chlorophos]